MLNYSSTLGDKNDKNLQTDVTVPEEFTVDCYPGKLLESTHTVLGLAQSNLSLNMVLVDFNLGFKRWGKTTLVALNLVMIPKLTVKPSCRLLNLAMNHQRW